MARASLQRSINKKRKFSCAGHSNSNSNLDSWPDLETNILHDIFQLLTPKELFHVVSKVCQSWRSACWDVLFWKDEETLELTNLSEFFDPYKFSRGGLKFLFKSLALNLSQRCVKNLIFARHVYFGLTDIIFLSTRLPMVKRVVIPNARFCNLGGLLRFWKHLEEVSIGVDLWNCMFEDFLNMNSYSKNLTTLNLSGKLYNDEQYAYFRLTVPNSNLIAKCLHQLKVLSIENYDVHKDGVRTILHECKNLSRLNIESCRRTWPSAERVFGIRRKDPSTMITGKIEKKIHGENVRWSIDSMERLFSLEEVLDHLFISN